MRRLAVSANNHARLKRVATKRYRNPASISKLGSAVLDTYLAHMERAYFGRAGATSCAAVPASARAVDAVILDMDSALCDSESISRQVGAAVFLNLYRIDVQPHEFPPFLGTDEGEFLMRVANKRGVLDFDIQRAKQEFLDIYVSGGYALDLSALPGARSLMERTKQLGLKLALISPSDVVKVEENLKAIGISRTSFDAAVTARSTSKKKPAPDMYFTAAHQLGVDPARCVVVEDTIAGVIGAKAAGMRCVALTTRIAPELLDIAGADVARPSPSSIQVSDIFGHGVQRDAEL